MGVRQSSPRKPWDHGGKSRIARGYEYRWMKLRLVVLARDKHLCRPCRRSDRFTPATAVDHIVPKSRAGGDDLDNLEAICTSCHRDKTLADQGKRVRRRIAPDGWPEWPGGAVKSTHPSEW